VYKAESLTEKTQNPKTRFTIKPKYVFGPSFFQALEKTEQGYAGEIQVTDAIQR
jgi:UTP-glucose-1-phosphate uridylyltransferase